MGSTIPRHVVLDYIRKLVENKPKGEPVRSVPPYDIIVVPAMADYELEI